MRNLFLLFWLLAIPNLSFAENCIVNDKDIADDYTGGCKNGLANGFGTATGKDKYVGMFLNGNKHGKGTYTRANGNRYEGDWDNDKPQGKGTHTWANGDRYEGDWKNGVREGKGTLAMANGDRYEGDWKNDLRQGKGIYTWSESNKNCGNKWCKRKYIGTWYMGHMNVGHVDFFNGDIYDGYMNSDASIGNPSEVQLAGAIQKHWIADKNGCKVWNQSPGPGESITWSGPCKDGYAEGSGAVQWFTDGKPGVKYQGELVDGKYHGKGTLIYPGECKSSACFTKYAGSFEDSRKRCGHADFSDGDSYDGCFNADGKMEGPTKRDIAATNQKYARTSKCQHLYVGRAVKAPYVSSGGWNLTFEGVVTGLSAQRGYATIRSSSNGEFREFSCSDIEE